MADERNLCPRHRQQLGKSATRKVIKLCEKHRGKPVCRLPSDSSPKAYVRCGVLVAVKYCPVHAGMGIKKIISDHGGYGKECQSRAFLCGKHSDLKELKEIAPDSYKYCYTKDTIGGRLSGETIVKWYDKIEPKIPVSEPKLPVPRISNILAPAKFHKWTKKGLCTPCHRHHKDEVAEGKRSHEKVFCRREDIWRIRKDKAMCPICCRKTHAAIAAKKTQKKRKVLFEPNSWKDRKDKKFCPICCPITREELLMA